MINSKKKGNIWENNWKNWLLLKGIRAWKDAQSGGGNREKSDVGNDLNINFEVKAGKNISLQKAYKQSLDAAVATHTIPNVVIHYDGMPQDEFLIVMNNNDWMDLYRKSVEPKTTKTENRELQWVISNLREACKKALKKLE